MVLGVVGRAAEAPADGAPAAVAAPVAQAGLGAMVEVVLVEEEPVEVGSNLLTSKTL